MDEHHPHAGHDGAEAAGFGGWTDVLAALPWLAALVLFFVALVLVRRRGRSWSPTRSCCWVLGCLASLVAVAGPLAELSHRSFVAHMIGHLLLGMLGPLLLVCGAPVTLALRALPVREARRLVRVLSSPPVRFFSHPLTAGAGGLGGLWLLYTTDLYRLSHSHPGLHLLVHAHVALFGYLFTAAVMVADPNRHRVRWRGRTAWLVLFAAGHAVLAKYLYGHPPAGVPAEQAEAGSMLMYYGGDLVEVALMVLLCLEWYRRTAPGRANRAALGFDQLSPRDAATPT